MIINKENVVSSAVQWWIIIGVIRMVDSDQISLFTSIYINFEHGHDKTYLLIPISTAIETIYNFESLVVPYIPSSE